MKDLKNIFIYINSIICVALLRSEIQFISVFSTLVDIHHIRFRWSFYWVSESHVFPANANANLCHHKAAPSGAMAVSMTWPLELTMSPSWNNVFCIFVGIFFLSQLFIRNSFSAVLFSLLYLFVST